MSDKLNMTLMSEEDEYDTNLIEMGDNLSTFTMKGGGMANMMRGLGGLQGKMGPGELPGTPPGGKFPRV